MSSEFWTLGYENELIQVQDSKGLAYILHLLRSPGTEFHVFDLIQGSASSTPSPTITTGWTRYNIRVAKRDEMGDAGEMLDEHAINSYRSRVNELRDAIEDAKERDDTLGAENARQEMEALVRELSRAVGIRGRRRRAASGSERARISVRKAIKYAVDRIEENTPSLARLLSLTIATGNFCSYNPSATELVEWDFGASRISPTGQPAGGALREKAIDQKISRGISPSGDRTRFAGRASERKQIADAFERARSGNGSLITVSGPPGVGKTRLAVECGREVAQNSSGLVLIGHSYERHGATPFLPFVEMVEMALNQTQSFEAFREALGENATELCQLDPRLRRIFKDIQPPIELPPEQARRYLFESLCDFLVRSAAATPLVLILDDLQWADESTLSLLTYLVSRIERSAILAIATYRDVELNTRPVFLGALEDLIRAGTHAIRLIGLPRNSVSEMLHSLAGRQPPDELIDLICDQTDGNPFFVEELFKVLVEEHGILDSSGRLRSRLSLNGIRVPENVRLLTARRLAQLSLETQRWLEGAAIIGRSFSFKLLGAAIQRDDDALLDAIDEARDAGLIVASSDKEAPFAFVHEIVRQAILTSLSLPRRQQLHLRVAKAFIRLHTESGLEDRAAEIVHHLVEAGAEASPEEVLRFSIFAGQRAMQAAAYEDALGHFEEALKNRPSAESAETANLLFELGIAKRSLGRWEEALADWERSLDTFAGLGDPEASGRVAATIAEALSMAGRHFDAARIAYRGLSLVEGGKDADKVRILAALGLLNTAAGAFQQAHEELAEALKLAETLQDERIFGVVLSFLAFHHYTFGRFRDAIALGRRSVQLLRATGSMWALAQMLGFLQQATLLTSEVSEARAIGRELEPLAAKIGHTTAMMLFARARAWTEFYSTSDFATLTANLQQDLEGVKSAKLPWLAGSYAQLAVANFYTGDWPAALEQARLGFSSEFPSAFEGYCTGALIRQCAYSGRSDEALELLEQKRCCLPRLGSPSTIGSCALLMLSIEALFVMDRRQQSAELYPLAEQVAESDLVCFAEISRFPKMVAAISAAAGGHWDIAEAHFAQALRQAEAFPHPVEPLEIKRFYAQTLLERAQPGDHAKAKGLLSAALEGYTKLKMPRHVAIVRSLAAN